MHDNMMHILILGQLYLSRYDLLLRFKSRMMAEATDVASSK